MLSDNERANERLLYARLESERVKMVAEAANWIANSVTLRDMLTDAAEQAEVDAMSAGFISEMSTALGL